MNFEFDPDVSFSDSADRTEQDIKSGFEWEYTGNYIKYYPVWLYDYDDNGFMYTFIDRCQFWYVLEGKGKSNQKNVHVFKLIIDGWIRSSQARFNMQN